MSTQKQRTNPSDTCNTGGYPITGNPVTGKPPNNPTEDPVDASEKQAKIQEAKETAKDSTEQCMS